MNTASKKSADKQTRNAYRASLWLSAEYQSECTSNAARDGRKGALGSRFADTSVRCPWNA